MTWILFCDHSKRREDWERSIFVRLKEGGYRLQENILFHLYVSTSPCGDARLNSPYEITTDCKRKYFPLFFSPLCLLLLICLFILRPILLSLLTDLQKIYCWKQKHCKVHGMCVYAGGAPSPMLGGKIMARQNWNFSTFLRLHGSAG